MAKLSYESDVIYVRVNTEQYKAILSGCKNKLTSNPKHESSISILMIVSYLYRYVLGYPEYFGNLIEILEPFSDDFNALVVVFPA